MNVGELIEQLKKCNYKDEVVFIDMDKMKYRKITEARAVYKDRVALTEDREELDA